MFLTQTDLISQLLALNSPDKPFLIEVTGNQITASWNFVDAKWLKIFGEAGLKKGYKLTLFLNEADHSVRLQEETSEIQWSAGVPHLNYHLEKFKGDILFQMDKGVAYGVKPDLSLGQVYKYNFNPQEIKDPILNVVTQAGWKVSSKGSGLIKVFVIVVLVIVGLLMLLGVLLAKTGALKINTYRTDGQGRRIEETTDTTENMDSSPQTIMDEAQPTEMMSESEDTRGLVKLGNTIMGQQLSQGKITDPATVVRDSYSKVYFQTEVENAVSGDEFTMYLTYLSTSEQMETTVTADANNPTVVTMTFTPPTTGMIAGDYEYLLVAPDGQDQKSFFFTVE